MKTNAALPVVGRFGSHIKVKFDTIQRNEFNHVSDLSRMLVEGMPQVVKWYREDMGVARDGMLAGAFNGQDQFSIACHDEEDFYVTAIIRELLDHMLLKQARDYQGEVPFGYTLTQEESIQATDQFEQVCKKLSGEYKEVEVGKPAKSASTLSNEMKHLNLPVHTGSDYPHRWTNLIR